jgi:hypothetical protein
MNREESSTGEVKAAKKGAHEVSFLDQTDSAVLFNDT